MTMQGLMPPPPPPGFWLALLETDDPSELKLVMDEVADEYTDERFVPVMDATIKALNLRKLPPRERLAKYLLKPLSMWLEQRQKYFKDFREDWEDFRRLKDRAIRGDFDDVDNPQRAALRSSRRHGREYRPAQQAERYAA